MYMKKTILSAALALLTAIPSMALEATDSVEKPTRSIYAEILGPSNLIGVHFDSRLKGNSGWGYSAGMAWGYSSSDDFFSNVDRFHMISIVPRVSYLVGRKSSKLEMGFGVNIGFLTGTREYDTYDIRTKDGDTILEYAGHVKEHRDFMAYYFFGNIGYRLQPARGFTLRAGVSPAFGLGGSHTLDDLYLIPYVSVGKSF